MKYPQLKHADAIATILGIARTLQMVDLNAPQLREQLAELRSDPTVLRLMLGAVRYEVTSMLKDTLEGDPVVAQVTQQVTVAAGLVTFESLYGESDQIPLSKFEVIDDSHWRFIQLPVDIGDGYKSGRYTSNYITVIELTAIHPCEAN